MKTLLLIPSVLKADVTGTVAADRHPRMDYHALADALRRDGATADLLDYEAVERERHPLVRAALRGGGRDAALAACGFLHRRCYDAIFTNGENVGIPLSLLLKAAKRPAHVTIGHRLSSGKKTPFFRHLRADRGMDAILVYARTQQDWAQDRLGIPAARLRRIAFHADTRFYRPLPHVPVNPHQICSAGLEWRDYPTLIAAVRDMPDLQVRLAAASPWSKHRSEVADRTLPPNVDARRYDYAALRDLYARSSFVVVPLYENDFQAGVTTLLEAMAMGKAVIVTRTVGQTDVIVDGENGLTVAPGDVSGWERAIRRLRGDPALCAALGRNARRWVEENATLDRWVGHVQGALRAAASPAHSKAELQP